MRRGESKIGIFCLLWVCSCAEPPHLDTSSGKTPDTEIARLPAPLRERFDTPAGRDEMTRALQDRALLVAEARRRGFVERDDIKKAVVELEERLAVQALLASERTTIASTEQEQRAWFDAHRADFHLPERRQTERILVAIRGDKSGAELKAKALRQRLDAGEAFAKLAEAGDGAERLSAGRIGAIAADADDSALAEAVFSASVGTIVGPVVVRDGLALLRVTAVLPSTDPPFESVRGDVENRLQPALERRAFEQLLQRLRGEAKRE